MQPELSCMSLSLLSLFHQAQFISLNLTFMQSPFISESYRDYKNKQQNGHKYNLNYSRFEVVITNDRRECGDLIILTGRDKRLPRYARND